MVCPESYKSAVMAVENRPQANTDSVRVMIFCAVFGLARPALLQATATLSVLTIQSGSFLDYI